MMGAVSVRCDDGRLVVHIDPAAGATWTGDLAPGGTIVVTWHGPSSHDPSLSIEWGTATVTIPQDLDCTPTTSQAAPTTSEVTTSTPASTLPPTSVPATTWAIDTPQTAAIVEQRLLPATGEPPTAGIIGGALIVLAPLVWWWGIRGRRPA